MTLSTAEPSVSLTSARPTRWVVSDEVCENVDVLGAVPSYGRYIEPGDGSETLALVYDYGMSSAGREHAELMAAAPQLLDALEMAYQLLAGLPPEWQPSNYAKQEIRAALVTARGIR